MKKSNEQQHYSPTFLAIDEKWKKSNKSCLVVPSSSIMTGILLDNENEKDNNEESFREEPGTDDSSTQLLRWNRK